MRYSVVCMECNAVVWIRGCYESDTNALILRDNDPNWVEACDHIKAGGDYDIGDEEILEIA